MAIEVDRSNVAAISGDARISLHEIPEYVRATHGPDGGTVLDVLHGQMFRLNIAGLRILEMLREGLTTLAIAERLASEFGIDCAITLTDVRDFVETLEKRQLLISHYNSALS